MLTRRRLQHPDPPADLPEPVERHLLVAVQVLNSPSTTRFDDFMITFAELL